MDLCLREVLGEPLLSGDGVYDIPQLAQFDDQKFLLTHLLFRALFGFRGRFIFSDLS